MRHRCRIPQAVETFAQYAATFAAQACCMARLAATSCGDGAARFAVAGRWQDTCGVCAEAGKGGPKKIAAQASTALVKVRDCIYCSCRSDPVTGVKSLLRLSSVGRRPTRSGTNIKHRPSQRLRRSADSPMENVMNEALI
jgi:hypothetical protein